MNTSNESAKVMIVEDEPILLEAIKKRFESRNIPTITFSSAKEALSFLNKSKEKSTELPGVIWLDYYLSEMDGLEFLGEINRDSVTASIPVLVVSNSASNEKIKKMLTLGVEKYLLKANHRLDDLIDLTTEFINQKEENKQKDYAEKNKEDNNS